MRSLWPGLVVAIAVLGGCQKDKSGGGFKAAGSGAKKVASMDLPASKFPGKGSSAPGKPQIKQVTPSFDTKTPPADAIHTKSGLIYKKITSVADGPSPGKNDTVKIHYTGWKSTGETVYSTIERGQPMPMMLQQIPPGFAEGMELMKKGEKVMMWIPPDIGYRDGARPQTPEMMAYEVELIDIDAAPAVPADVGKPPATAEKTAGGNSFVVVKPGTGKDKPHDYDNTVFNLTAWDAAGNQLESTETGARKRPTTQPPFRLPAGLGDLLLGLTVGERARCWIPADQLQLRQKPVGDGPITVEIELVDIQKQTPPPAVPKDVAAPPKDAKKTAKGVFYKVLKPGKGKAPVATDTVSVNYTGWTTDGKMFDSSVVRGQPSEFPLNGVIQGWTDGLQQMHVGESVRFWIPQDLAYQGRPGKPAGMLVFDVDLLAIKGPPPPPGKPPATPADVAAPPKDAKKTDKGVFFKVLKAGKAGGKQPGPTDTVKVQYTGWTTDGKLFDSSVTRGQPAEFPLNGVIAGWTDGLQQMHVGDSFRFWIPVELAYNNAPGKPAGMLVFDVELLDVKSSP